MKIHSILACLIIGSSTSLIAQNSVDVSKSTKSVSKAVSMPMSNANATSKAAAALGEGKIDEVIVGVSTYDLQTNNSVQPRFMVHPDGKMSVAWTMSLGGDNSDGFPDRGTGYNFYDGSSWGDEPTERIEDVRTGWPSFVTLPGGGEAYICHVVDGQSLFAKRDVAGTGAWTSGPVSDGTTTLSNTWHRMAIGGADGNSLHVIGAENLGGTGDDSEYYLRYSRSTDLGATWDLVNVEIPAIADSIVGRIGGDAYSIVADGDNIAFVFGGSTQDMLVMKSSDNGTTWTKNILWEFPIENYDESSDLIDSTVVTGNDYDAYLGSDGSYHLMYDANNELHAFFGSNIIFNEDTTDGDTFSSRLQDGLLHWKESYGYTPDSTATIDGSVMGVTKIDTVAYVLDQNGDGEFENNIPLSYGVTLTSMPYTYVAGNGDIYLTYASTIDTIAEFQLTSGDPRDKNQRHQWITKSTDNGVTWEDPQDLLKIFAVEENELVETVYGSVVVNDDVVYVFYQRDETPGVHVSTNNSGHDVEENDMVVASFLVSDYEILTVEETNKGIFNVAPNPATEFTTVNLEEGHENGTVSVINALGQTLYTAVAEGNKLTINTSNFNAGLYIVNVTEGDNVYTQKLVVE